MFLFKDLKKTTLYLNTMDRVYNQFKSMWSKSVISQDNNNMTNVQIFHKAKLINSCYHDMIDYLKEEFYNTKQNVFELHLYLVENCLDHNEVHKLASAFMINNAFVEWRNQIRNLNRKKNIEHLTSTCKEDVCNCKTNDLIISNAFNLAIRKNITLLGSFNKIYNFNDNYHLLQAEAVNCISKLNYTDQATLIGELQVQDKFNIENVNRLIDFIFFSKKRILN